MSKPITKDCYILVKVIEGTWLKDADFFGKQDPFVSFKHNGIEFKTTVKDDAGKKATWNEEFKLMGIPEALELNTYDN
jgi:Ca2+-dependent lipid-binding protein